MPEASKKVISIDRNHQFCNQDLLLQAKLIANATYRRNFRKWLAVNFFLAVFVSVSFDIFFENLDVIFSTFSSAHEESFPGKHLEMKCVQKLETVNYLVNSYKISVKLFQY